jgi:hypothetical protein
MIKTFESKGLQDLGFSDERFDVMLHCCIEWEKKGSNSCGLSEPREF